MTNREIKFKAAYKLDTGTVIVDNVVVYPNGKLGCSLDDFDKALPNGHHMDCAANIIEKEFLDNDGEIDFVQAGRFIGTGEDWVWFEGKPLQFTNKYDKGGNEIYDNHVLEYEGLRCLVKYHDDWGWCLERGTQLIQFRYYDIDKFTILGFIDQDPNLIPK